MDLLTSLVVLALVAGLYFVPSIIAWRRHVAPRVGILLVNLLLGWTMFGWVGSLIWAVSTASRPQ
ncbi:MAG: superinfection immunity protein [Proteobacteria bacterium]|nr:superinfection immunity protein [Pseudomonadota bacterium]